MRQYTNLLEFANQLLLMHMRAVCGIGEALPACVAAKEKLVREFASYIADQDELATPREFMRVFQIEIGKHSPFTDDERKAIAAVDRPDWDIPFSQRSIQGISFNDRLELTE